MKRGKVNCAVTTQYLVQLQEIIMDGWFTLVSSACRRGPDLEVEDGVLGCVAAWVGGRVRRNRVMVDSNEEGIEAC